MHRYPDCHWECFAILRWNGGDVRSSTDYCPLLFSFLRVILIGVPFISIKGRCLWVLLSVFVRLQKMRAITESWFWLCAVHSVSRINTGQVTNASNNWLWQVNEIKAYNFIRNCSIRWFKLNCKNCSLPLRRVRDFLQNFLWCVYYSLHKATKMKIWEENHNFSSRICDRWRFILCITLRVTQWVIWAVCHKRRKMAEYFCCHRNKKIILFKIMQNTLSR